LEYIVRMTDLAVTTRFAPSPTGELHLGNVRTALFNWLLAHQTPGGKFLLRIEDTDQERSRPEYARSLQEDLAWLGLTWDGPIVYQSARGPAYATALTQLCDQQQAYECFCTPVQLDLERRSQLASGRPPRYSGRCRALASGERARRRAAGESYVMRFAVPESGATEFTDLVHGHCRYAHADIGDFVLQRADQSAAFFFSNAVDDAASGVTHVLRGDDHLSNTPRQILILRALGLVSPTYGHLALLTGNDGAPLSKRNGAQSLGALRALGYLPAAVQNQLFRLGHSTGYHDLGSLPKLAAEFQTAHLQRAPARFELSQLRVWQKLAVQTLDAAAQHNWLADALAPLELARRDAFVKAVLPNLVLPDDAKPWLDVISETELVLTAEAQAAIASAGAGLFAAASAAAPDNDFAAISAAAKNATGLKGPALFKPLRAALTGRLDGPELASLLTTMPAGLAQRRLARFA
jgi:nondiscriminating glutamyl-tRNA synthetase